MKKQKKVVVLPVLSPREILKDSTSRAHAHMSSADVEQRRQVEQLRLTQTNAAVARLTHELKQAVELAKDITAIVAGLDEVLNTRG